MQKFILAILLIAGLSPNLWAQQTTIRVVLHPIVSMVVGETVVRCEARQRDLLVSIPLESFVVPSGELLRLELLHMTPEEKVGLTYNKIKTTNLTYTKPNFTVYPKRGVDEHLFELRFQRLPIEACRTVTKAIRFTLEPR